ncbi:hypothetical protein DV736_g6426, partial [Chaetothyriales sp. CBS 134916]
EVQQELDLYNTATSSPELTKVFISAADKRSVSVTGPPSRLKNAFATSHRLRYSRSLQLPVFGGLCHALHLYKAEDLKSIIHGSERCDKHTRRALIPLFSPQKGEPFCAENASELLTAVVSEILTGKIYLDNLTKGIIGELTVAPGCRFIQYRSSIISQGLLSDIDTEYPKLALVNEDLFVWSTKDSIGARPSSTKHSKLAIVGMSCRLPGGANNHELFWQLLVDGRDVHTTVPADRFDLYTHFDATGKTPNATETQYGNFIDNPGFFDAHFFNMSPREAEQTDPMHRLALVTGYEALEMAGYSPNRTPSTNLKRIGTFYGQASDDWRELNGGQNIGTYAVPGGERAFANGRINYFFGFSGPSFNIDTACSSGLAAVNTACSALWSGEADMVLAGGLSVITHPDNYCMLCKGHFLSKTGQCKVWDKDADGYCRADGIGAVVIKRLEDAEVDNDNIIGVVASGYTNHSAEAVSITHPHAGAQMENYNQVMANAGVNPLDVTYIELHGTGTQAGDAVESESVAGVFAPLSARRKPEQRLHLGAVKSNLGHSENQIPPHVGIKSEINPVVARNLDRRNAGLVFENTPWPRQDSKKRYALVNSFGAHGGNTTLLLEDAPDRPRFGVDPRSTYPFTLSAKSKHSLYANIEALIQFLDKHPDTDLGDLSYTLCARRMHHTIRVATTARSLPELRKFLESSLNGVNDLRGVSTTPPSVVMTFTGQGASYEGMSSQLYRDFPYYRQQIQELDRLVQKLGFHSIVPYIENSERLYGAGEQDLDKASPLITQLCVLVLEIALSRFWQFLGVVPCAVIGHSLGEYAAFVTAGVISAADAIFLVAKRAKLLGECCTPGSHGMLSVRASGEAIHECVGTVRPYEISCRNGVEDTVISGEREDIEAISATLKRKGLKAVVLDIPYAFHSAQLDRILSPFEEFAKHVTFKAPSIPIISPLLADCVFDGKTINARYLSLASREPVLFVDALDAAKDTGIIDEKTVWLDIGPHPVCSAFVRSWTPDSKVFASLQRNEDNFATVADSVCGLYCSGIPVCWSEYFRPYERAHRLLTLDAYKWNEKNYWIPYLGTWTLDKAFPAERRPRKDALPSSESSFRTLSIHQILSEEVDDSKKHARLTAISDLKHPSLLPSVKGHKMNGYGVATTSIWGDMGLTVGEYLFKLLVPDTKEVHMNLTNIEVLHAQVISDNPNKPHLIQVEASLDLDIQSTFIQWYSMSGATPKEAFASCTIRYEDPKAWQREWNRINHFVTGRVSDLERLATAGEATQLNRKMAYVLFGNVVDYAEEYRGMRSVVLSGFEAVADVSLAPDAHGTWHSAPHFIDSVFHVGGLVLNGGDAVDTRDYFYVTPGWSSYRLLNRLRPAESYRSYVCMAPAAEANMYAGDVYLLQDGVVIGMMGEMKFRRVPRLLMNHFFSPADAGASVKKDHESGVHKSATTARCATSAAGSPAPIPHLEQLKQEEQPAVSTENVPSEPTTQDAAQKNPFIADCLELIARETGLEKSQLTDEASFVELGVDSLMSLVLSEKFCRELQLDVKSSLFLECTNIRALKEWLEGCC